MSPQAARSAISSFLRLVKAASSVRTISRMVAAGNALMHVDAAFCSEMLAVSE